jgi:hypothetical protein
MAANKNPPWLPPLPADARFKIARAEAIEAYSSLEISLARIFAEVLSTKPDLAGIVLFRIGNTRARNRMIEQLIKRRYGPKYNLYWNSLFKFIGQLDQTRNEVVHWSTSVLPNFNRSGTLTSATVKLVPPNIWDRKRGKQKLTERDLKTFALKCDFAEAAVWSFVTFAVSRYGSRKRRATWRDIFQQPLAYPPPENHPICQRWPKRIMVLVPSRS